MNSLKDKMLEFWGKQTPEKKKKYVAYIGIVSLIVGGSVVYKVTHTETPPPPAHVSKERKNLLVAPDLEKGMFIENQKKITEMNATINSLRKELTDFKEDLGKKGTETTLKNIERFEDRNNIQPKNGEGHHFPKGTPPPPLPGGALFQAQRPGMGPGIPSPPPGVGTPSQIQQPLPQYIGDIEVIENTKKGAGETNGPQQGSGSAPAKKDTSYLPPSFMKASLLTGAVVNTMGDGKNDYKILLFRVAAPSVLPNRIKANLKDCFVLAEAKGNLAEERADVRLTSLSCIAKNGTAVIDQKIKGYVVDADGKSGMKGEVVTKAGTMITRAFLSGFLGGAGEAIKTATTTPTTVNLTGSTSTIDVDVTQAMAAGVGAGISNASKEIQKFYMELARQTLPVIEVGATKDVTLVITEGVALQFKDECVGGDFEECIG